MCTAQVKIVNKPTPSFYRLDTLPFAKPTVSEARSTEEKTSRKAVVHKIVNKFSTGLHTIQQSQCISRGQGCDGEVQWRHRSAGGPLTDLGLGSLTFNPPGPTPRP